MTPETEAHDGDGGHGGTLSTAARRILEAAWRDDGAGGGYCVPNATTYPWQWLWDSCFHAVIWAHLGDDRAVAELTSALTDQDGDGFVPHLRYGADVPHAALWGRAGTSSITQPPMYGHAARVLHEQGLLLPEELLHRAARGIRFLLHRRSRTAGGLVEICHPWESGCDDSPRWDDTVDGKWSAARWYEVKGALVGSIERSATGAPLHNPAFAVGSVGFSALVAWNARELASVTDDEGLRADATELTEAVDARWDDGLATWVDDGPTAIGSGRTRTLDGLLPLLVCGRREAADQLIDPEAFGAPCGPTGVHRAEPTFAPSTYWRGPSWPQLTYLLWVASTSADFPVVAESLARSMTRGALASGFAEYWEPDSGAPLGAVPQSWTGLVAVVGSR